MGRRNLPTSPVKSLSQLLLPCCKAHRPRPDQESLLRLSARAIALKQVRWMVEAPWISHAVDGHFRTFGRHRHRRPSRTLNPRPKASHPEARASRFRYRIECALTIVRAGYQVRACAAELGSAPSGRTVLRAAVRGTIVGAGTVKSRPRRSPRTSAASQASIDFNFQKGEFIEILSF